MSGESIYNLLPAEIPSEKNKPGGESYEKHVKEMPKPSYSTFYEKGGKYDGTHVPYFKQRDAIIGVSVGKTIDPKHFTRCGEGVKCFVEPMHKDKLFTKAPLDHGVDALRKKGKMKRMLPYSSELLEGQNGSGTVPQQGSGTLGDRKLMDSNVPDANNSDTEIVPDFSHKKGEQKKKQLNRHPTFTEGSGSGKSQRDTICSPTNEDFRADDADHIGSNNKLHGPSVLEDKQYFPRSNKIRISNMVPKRRKEQPEHPTLQKTFGKVPDYLNHVKKQLEEERFHIHAIENAERRNYFNQLKKHVYCLDESERSDLISKLRALFNEKTVELNKIPFAKDTVSQVTRRAKLEKEINDIEKSIAKLDKDAVFIYNDNPGYSHWTKNAAMEEACRYASHGTS